MQSDLAFNYGGYVFFLQKEKKDGQTVWNFYRKKEMVTRKYIQYDGTGYGYQDRAVKFMEKLICSNNYEITVDYEKDFNGICIKTITMVTSEKRVYLKCKSGMVTIAYSAEFLAGSFKYYNQCKTGIEKWVGENIWKGNDDICIEG